MCQSPALMRVLASDRVADLRQLSESGVRDKRARPRVHGLEAARLATGWLLVDVGLRLALPRASLRRSVVRHPSHS